MLTAYCLREGRVTVEPVEPGRPLPPNLIWVDLMEPSPDEEHLLEAVTGIDVPTPEEMREIESSSRLYREGPALFMTASILNKTETPDPETRAITFILVNGMMITLRYCSPLPFRLFPARLHSQPELAATAEDALINLLDAIVDRVADTLETVDTVVGSLSKSIFSPLDVTVARTQDFTSELKSIGLNAIRCSKVDESLVTLSRLLTFLDANLRQSGNKQSRAHIKDLQRDILSLSSYVERLSEKLVLMLEATLGMINIQQNAIIKIFSVLAVVLLPPTLIASIYGMNFDFMPELHWTFGYPMALGMMVLSAIIPYWLFKRRGWL
jgi:magnesium transporter